MGWLDKFGRERRRRKELIGELRRLRHDCDDLLSDAEKKRFAAALEELNSPGAPGDAAGLEGVRGRCLGERAGLLSGGAMRSWLDLFLVVGAVAFGVRALFLQPFRIPTGSMQPTLYGMHYLDRETASNPLLREKNLPDWLNGVLFAVSRAEARSGRGGYLDPASIRSEKGFVEKTRFTIGGESLVLPGAPAKVADYARFDAARRYAPGETVADGYFGLGDHLFVERLSLYLKEPCRGDVMVFVTDGLAFNGRRLADTGGVFYIKRLAGVPGDTLRITGGELEVKPAGAGGFTPIRELDERFDKLYSGKGGYQGHSHSSGEHLFRDGQEYVVPEDSYFMLGDNTAFSLDSRYFGSVPRKNLIGRAFWVFWPFSRRWGLADRAGALDAATGESYGNSFPVMSRQ